MFNYMIKQSLKSVLSIWVGVFCYAIIAFATVTPLSSYAAVITHSGTINADETWSASDIHYISSGLTVATGATLTIEPGAIIKTNVYISITINGSLHAGSLTGAKVLFTSYNDDAADAGGNTNGSGASPTNGWGYIYFATSSSGNYLRNTEVRYSNKYYGQAILSQSDLEIGSSKIHDNGGAGVYAYGNSATLSKLTIKDSAISNNGGDGVYASSYVDLSLVNNQITNNTLQGLQSNTSSNISNSSNNTITGNGKFSSVAIGNYAALSNGLTTSGLEISGGTLSADADLKAEHGPYYISSDLTVATGATLTIEPGAIIKTNVYISITINGSLHAGSLTGAKVLFTSYNDDAADAGGNTNGSGASPTNGWGYIYFATSSSGNYLRNTEVRYSNKYYGHAILSQSDLEISSSKIHDNGGAGVYTYGVNSATLSKLTIKDSAISNNGGDGVYASSYADLSLINNQITNNTLQGLQSNTSSNISNSSNNTITGNGKFSSVAIGNYAALSNGLTTSGLEISGGTLSADADLKAEHGPYYISSDLTVATGATLTIEPGAIIKTNVYISITINGSLHAGSLTGAKVLFTSYNDDAADAGDNTNGSGASPTNGWGYIYFATSSSGNYLRNTEVRYSNKYYGHAILSQSDLEISSSKIHDNGGAGVYTYGVNSATLSKLTIKDSAISNNGGDGVYASSYADLSLINNQITNNTLQGLQSNTSSNISNSSNNTITGNGKFSSVAIGNYAALSNGLTTSGLEIVGGTLSADADLKAEHGPYYISSDLTVATGATLTIEPGAIIKTNVYISITINGSLHAGSLTGAKVLFTSYNDDAADAGGNTNGSGASPTNGWGYIYFNGPSSGNYLRNTEVRYTNKYYGHAILSQSDLEISSSKIHDNGGAGVYAYGVNSATLSKLTIKDSEISNNGGDGVYASSYADLSLINNQISNNIVTGLNISNNNGINVEKFDNNTITDNGAYGINSASIFKDFSGNTITGNNVAAKFPIDDLVLGQDDNTFGPNTFNRIELTGGSVNSDLDTTQLPFTEYLVSGNISVATSASLIMKYGTTWHTSTATNQFLFNVNGEVQAIGKADNILSISNLGFVLLDDKTGNPKRSSFDYVKFENCVSDCIDMRHDNVIVQNSTFSSNINNNYYSSNPSIHLSNINYVPNYPKILNNQFWGKTYAIFMDDDVDADIEDNRFIGDQAAIYMSGSSNADNYKISNNSFLNYGSALMPANRVFLVSNNWWGDNDATGPYNATNNPSGSGVLVTDTAQFTPFVTKSLFDYAYMSFGDTPVHRGTLPDITVLQGTQSSELYNNSSSYPAFNMISDPQKVSLGLSGLDPNKKYRLLVNYDNPDYAYLNKTNTPITVKLTDAKQAEIHSALTLGSISNVNYVSRRGGIYDFLIPATSIDSSGNLTLNFELVNQANNLRVVIYQLWLVEDNSISGNNTKFDTVLYSDVDGSGTLSVGDEYRFYFSTIMDDTKINSSNFAQYIKTDDATNFGNNPVITWSADKTVMTVALGAGFTITGNNEQVNVVNLPDKEANLVSGSATLNTIDKTRPEFTALQWIDADNSLDMSVGDKYVFKFSKAINTSIFTNFYTTASLLYSNYAFGNGSYEIAADNKSVTITLGDGFSLRPNTKITPSASIKDMAGNSVMGYQVVQSDDKRQPTIVDYSFNDKDGSGTVSIGDTYTFYFDKAMDRTSLVTNTDQANTELTPGNKIYGTTNVVSWANDNKSVTIEVTSGFTLTGNELVTPSANLVDASGNTVANTMQLGTTDKTVPIIVQVSGNETSPVDIGSDYKVSIQFSKTMDTSVLPNVYLTSSVASITLPTIGSGTWSQTVYPNDTYTTASISLTESMRSYLYINIGNAQDVSGNVFAGKTNALLFVLSVPVPAVTSHQLAPTVNTVSDNTVTISGTSDVATGIYCNSGCGYSAVNNGTWSIQVAVKKGTNTITLHAYHSPTNTASKTIQVILYLDPSFDNTGPVISNVVFGTVPVVDNMEINYSGYVDLSAIDAGSGTGYVNFYIDDKLAGNVVSDSAQYSWFFDTSKVSEGAHSLTIKAYDTLGNETDLTYQVNVVLKSPPKPTIVSPVDGSTASSNSITITGQSIADAQITLYIDGAKTTKTAVADKRGAFSIDLGLTEQQTSIAVSATNAKGESELSDAVKVSLDFSVIPPLTDVVATALPGGRIALSWSAVHNDLFKGYNIYRSKTPFTDVTSATKINSELVIKNNYTDAVSSDTSTDGSYYYRVAVVNTADIENTASNQVTAIADSTSPTASLAYAYVNNYDAGSDIVYQGKVNITLTLSETLFEAPYLAFKTPLDKLIVISLTKVDDTTYTGQLTIDETVDSGLLKAQFYGKDIVGNVGEVISAGDQLNINSDGPSIVSLTTDPVSPINNIVGMPQTIDLSIELSQAVADNTQPKLSWCLSISLPDCQADTQVITLVQSTVNPLVWTGSFELTSDAGATPEQLLFAYQAINNVGNISTKIADDKKIQIYQNALPPYGVPTGVKAVSKPAGAVAITWQPVKDATVYDIYRKVGGDDVANYVLVSRITDPNNLMFVDIPSDDGVYDYGVTSVRISGSVEASSAKSEPAQAVSDRVAPAAPTGLDSYLTGSGLKLSWNKVVDTDAVTYNVYRSKVGDIFILDANAIQIATGLTTTTYTDDKASNDATNYYTVTAVDAAGNESDIAESNAFSSDLYPVSGISIVQDATSGSGKPVISWVDTDTNVTSYDVYLGASSRTGVALATAVTDTNYIDTGYNNDERIYTVIANAGSAKSIGRTLELPNLSIIPKDGTKIVRGLMNNLVFTVNNLGNTSLTNVSLQIVIDGIVHESEPQTLLSKSSKDISIVVGGYADLPDITPYQATFVYAPNMGEKVTIIKAGSIAAEDNIVSLGVSTQKFTRGATGQVQFAIENNSATEIEIALASNNGNADSKEIYLELLDSNGNLLAKQNVRQYLGAYILTLSDGTSVARIPAGANFTSDWFTINVPNASPDGIYAKVVIDKIHYHMTRADAVEMGGVFGRSYVSLANTPYYGVLDSVTPKQSTGTAPVTIIGEAIDRSTDKPLAYVPLSVIVTVGKFEKLFSVTTDAAGKFSLDYNATGNEAGVYKVSVIHPELYERPENGSFIISKLIPSMTNMMVSTAFAYPQPLSLSLKASDGTDFNNIKIELLPADQPSGTLPQGLTLAQSADLSIKGGNTASINFVLTGLQIAGNKNQLVLRISADGYTKITTLNVDLRLGQGAPALVFDKNNINTGVTKGSSVTETAVVNNANGLAPAKNLVAKLTNPNNLTWGRISTADKLDQLGFAKDNNSWGIGLTFAPPVGTPDGVYPFLLTLTDDNGEVKNVTISVSVTADTFGTVQFKVEDIYTGYTGKGGNNGYAGATITLTNENVPTQVYTVTSGVDGVVTTNSLPTATYSYKASAPNHEPATGEVTVRSGITTDETVFLDYALVTVDWSVTDTIIDDHYDVVIDMTYATDVPVANVVMQPAVVKLPNLKAGDVFSGEIMVTNYGLVRADDIQLKLPTSDAYLTYEFLTDSVPTSLEAKQIVYIPYRVTAKRDLTFIEDSNTIHSKINSTLIKALRTKSGGLGGSSDGQSCGLIYFSYSQVTVLTDISVCENGHIVKKSATVTFTNYQSKPGTDNCGGSGSGGNSSSGTVCYGGCCGVAAGTVGCPASGGGDYGPISSGPSNVSGFPACRPPCDCSDCCGGVGGSNGGSGG